MRALAAVAEAHAGSLELHDILDGAEQHFALLGQNQAAGMAVEQRHLQDPARGRSPDGSPPIG